MNLSLQSTIVACLTVIFGFWLGFGATASPEFSPEKEGNIYLGITTEGQLKKGSFSVTNTGDSRLKIEHYMSNCSCLKVIGISFSSLDPGESGKFDFIFDTAGLAGKESKKEVILFTNAQNSPHRITISTRVRPRTTYQANSLEIIEEFSVLVDVRSPEKFANGHILGAKNVPRRDFSAWAKSLPEGVTVYVYSQEGEVSDSLVEKLGSELPLKLKSLVGGYQQWMLKHESYLKRSK